jgi:hypothetical protein
MSLAAQEVPAKPVKSGRIPLIERLKGKRSQARQNKRLSTGRTPASKAAPTYGQRDPYAGRKRAEGEQAAPYQGKTQRTSIRKERAWRGTISGNRLRSPRSASSSRQNVYPQAGPYVNSNSRTGNTEQSGRVLRDRVRVKSATGSVRNVYPQGSPYYKKYPSSVNKPVSNERELARARRMTSTGPPIKRGRITARSASSAFIVRRSPNTYAGKYSKGERAFTRDIAGRRLRTRNYRSAPAGLIEQPDTYRGRVHRGDTPYKGSAVWGFKTYTKRGERAWTTDAAGVKIRKNVTDREREVAGDAVFPPKLSRQRRGDVAYSGPQLGRVYRSRDGRTWNNQGRAVSGRAPGIGAIGINRYRGDFRRTQPGFGDQGGRYSGSIRARKPEKGGGSVSGRSWNNRNQSVPVRAPGRYSSGIGRYRGNIRQEEMKGFTQQGLRYQGTIKSVRPERGGGSVSGRLWNNNNRSIPVRAPGRASMGIGTYRGNMRQEEMKGFTQQGLRYQGHLETSRPEKGGGSVSGRLWNNNNRSIPVRAPGRASMGIGTYRGNLRQQEMKGFGEQGLRYQGNIKSFRPEKGGGSVSGRLWNNNNQSIPVRAPGRASMGIGNYRGHLRQEELKGFTLQGLAFRGNIKTKRPEKGGGSVSGKLWNNKENPIPGRQPGKNGMMMAGFRGTFKPYELKPGMQPQGEEFRGHMKAKRPEKGGGSISGKLWNNNEQPIQGRTPGKSAFAMRDYRGKNRQPDYVQNPNASKSSLLKQEPDKTTYAVGGLQTRLRRKDYVQNPNASKASLLKQEPDKTTYAVGGLQTRVKRGYDPERNPNSVRDALMGKPPEKASVRASEYSRVMKRYWEYASNPRSSPYALKGIAPEKAWYRAGSFRGLLKQPDYVHAPNAVRDALKVLPPGKANARIGDFQGNVKMKKYDFQKIFGDPSKHPDSQFANSRNDNVKGERTLMMNVKLLWGKLFRKNETQPTSVKEKTGRPRYDKREDGLWYD